MNNRTYYPNFENAYQADYPYCAKQAYYAYNQPYGAQQNYAPNQYPYYANQAYYGYNQPYGAQQNYAPNQYPYYANQAYYGYNQPYGAQQNYAPNQYPYYANQGYYGYNQPYGAQQNYAPNQYPYYAADNRDYKFYDNDAEYVLEYYNAEKAKYDISVVGHELRLRCREEAKNHPERYWSYYLPEDIDYSKMKAAYKENALYVYFAKRADIVKTIYSIKAS